MTDDVQSDPIELLRRANPHRLVDIRGAVRSPAAVALRDTITAEAHPAVTTRWNRHARSRRYELSDPDRLIGQLRARNPHTAAEVAGSSLSFTARRTFDLIAATPQRRWSRVGLRMMRRSDDQSMIGLLARSNPVPAAVVAGSRESLRAEMLFDAIVTDARPVPVHAIPRRRVLLALAIVSAVAASAAGYAVAQRHTTRATWIACYQSASVTASYVEYLPTSSPTSVCETHAWLQGAFGPPRHRQLVACVFPTGAIAVFPGTNKEAVCGRLHLATPLPPSRDVAAALALRNQLNLALTPQTCVPPQRAAAVTQIGLARLRLVGWNVTIGKGFSSVRPCSEALVLTQGHQVFIDPSVRLPPHPSGPLKV